MMVRGTGMFRGCGMLTGGLVGLIILGLIIYFIIKYFEENKGNSNTFTKINNANALLDERYAKGEIDEDEYTRRKRVLRD